MDDQTFYDEGDGMLDDSQDDNLDEDNNLNSDSTEEDGSSDNSVLESLKKITGRDFKDMDDFTKHYKNLNSFVGKKSKPEVSQKQPSSNEKELLEELNFKVDNPNLKDNFDIIKMVAKNKGISYNDAISDPLVKEILETRQSKKGESIIHSNNKISPSNSSVSKLKANVNTEEGLTAYLKATLEQE